VVNGGNAVLTKGKLLEVGNNLNKARNPFESYV
jgi:hypothetical protein